MAKTDIKVLTENSDEAIKFFKHKGKKPVTFGTVVTYIILTLYTIFLLAPFFIILLTSFVSPSQYYETPSFVWWPEPFYFDSFKQIFTDDWYAINGIPPIFLAFINTMLITLIPLFSGLTQSLLVSYIYSKYRFPGKNFLFMLTVTLMFIPLGAFGFVGFMFYQNLGWTEGWQALLPMMLPGMFAGAGTIFFLRPYVDGISNEIIEAAKIDGMGFWQIFFQIIFPLSKPALIAQFIFGFVGGYNNYTGALMYLDGEQQFWTLQLAVTKLIDFYKAEPVDFDFSIQCSMALVSMLPLIILYLCCQKFFIGGISFGGGKE